MAKTDKQLYLQWRDFYKNQNNSISIDRTETAIQKYQRIQKLEGNYEEWFAYYFPKFYTSTPASFHLRATKRVMTHPEWYEVRSWARELSKSGRTMMEVMYLVLTGKKQNILMVSNNYDNANRLLLPYKTALELNDRIINDYGTQQSLGAWEAGEFTTQKGVAFRALGAGQSPRGTRKDEVRPDTILIDDIDTDEECRNEDRIRIKMKWIEEALIPTRSISNPLLIIACGNIIAKYSCITKLGKKADKHEVINIRDKNGKSTWPSKNSEKDIDRVLSAISYNSAQKEYFNNPIIEGTVFKEVVYGKCPKLSTCDAVLVYADPATSNKDRGNASHKAIGIIARKGLTYYLYQVWLDTMSNDTFIDILYQAHAIVKEQGVDVSKVYIENNSLQDPFYEQVLYPLIRKKGRELGQMIPITPDRRRKSDKFIRIEGTLEPLNRNNALILNIKDKQNPNMQRMEAQILGVSEKQN